MKTQHRDPCAKKSSCDRLLASRALISFLLLCAVAVILQHPCLAGESLSSTSVGPRVPSAEGAIPIQQLSLEPAGIDGFRIVGPDASLQLLVIGKSEQGARVDLTRQANYALSPAGIAIVTETGLVRPLQDGQVRIIVGYGAHLTEVSLAVEDVAATQIVDFSNQVIPILTKLNCNGGGCHGKATGQNGFKLSLLGFYPEDDYEFIVKEGRGRRIFPAAPEKSLLLQKATGEVPHGGGIRMTKESQEYRTILRWIEQGVPEKVGRPRHVREIECFPQSVVLNPKGEHQIAVHAIYSDGSREDVTQMTIFEPNERELAEASTTGLVTALDLSGEVAVMARYQGHVATFRATIPLKATVPQLPQPRNFVDQAVFEKLKQLGIPASEPCDDATFLRRVSLDIAGRIPTADEATAFMQDSAADKRERLIDRLLDSPEYADFFTNKWNMVLRNKGQKDAERETTFGFHQWIWNSLYENKPYDQFVREIITATGDPRWNPPVTWYREVVGAEALAEDAAQLFLGVRVQCARCHHHPYDRWSQEDYYGLAAYFSRLGKKELGAEAPQGSRDRKVFHNDGVAQLPHPRTRQQIRPAGLGASSVDVPADQDPRVQLADWMTSAENEYFARCLVNRYWKHFFNRGLVEPEDDMRATNPPCNPELLDGLAKFFIDSGYDLKALIREICRSSTYQLSSEPNAENARDKQNFSRYYPRRMTAESLYDAFHQVTGAVQTHTGLPSGSTALQMPDPSSAPYFLKVFGQPQASSACECERSQAANLAQSLHLLNSQEVQQKIGNPEGRAHQLATQTDRSHTEKVRELYLTVFTREPDADELQAALGHLEKHKENPKGAYEDIVWALVNTKEFLFNH